MRYWFDIQPPRRKQMAKSSLSFNVTPKLKDYVFAEKLGSGTYATVYKACRKTGIREVVAIKCILKTSLNKKSTENLLTEIELLKKLKHEHIVELKDFLWDDKYIFLIMDLCSGGDLSHFLRKKRALPEIVVRRFLQQIALALHFLRLNNVAHMDLKPQNILLSSSVNPVLKIGDFGFAKHILEGTELHTLRGSPLYMAPEIICKRKYDSRVDLWSIGVILYECLFGQAPFASKSFQELEEKITDSKPIELPYGVEVSHKCRDLLLRLLKRNPDERIEFTEFFSHPFIDLEHAPSSTSLEKAKIIVSKAVEADKAENIHDAVQLYGDALEHFVAAIHYEKHSIKKETLRVKVQQYFNRAEELKHMLKPKTSYSRSLSTNSNTCFSTNSSTTNLDELIVLATNEEELFKALHEIKRAEIEIREEKYENALKKYESALEVCLQLIQVEPKGRRKELLCAEVRRSMSKAEEIKRYLSVQGHFDTNEITSEEKKTISIDQCRLQ